MPAETLTEEAAAAEAVALPARRREYNPDRLRRMDEALRIFESAMSGSLRGRAAFVEALSTSDFPTIFGDVLDRELLAQYDQLPAIWPQFARRTVVRDFRPKKFIDLIGGRGILERVDELAPYPSRTADEGEYELTVAKYGGVIGLSWESIVNDDLDMFRDLPTRLAQAARDTEDYIAAGLLTDGDGPNATLFSATAVHGTSSNLLAGNPALSTNALSAALAAIGARRDTEGRPIAISGYVLVVPPGLEVTALQIINATTIELGAAADTQRVTVNNWLRGKVTVVVNPWLTVRDLGANAATSWYVLPVPSASRPGLVLGFLRGHETPDLRVKADTGQRVGGGTINADEGSFENDDVAYRARHVVGGTTLDPIGAAYSNGSGA
jgi:hypothetical protein